MKALQSVLLVLIVIFSKPSQSLVQSCEKSLPEIVKKNLCELRQYKIFDGPEYDAHSSCLFKNFGYLKDDKIDKDAVLNDFNATLYLNKATKSDIERCTLDANKQQDANATSGVFVKCMVYSDSFEKFRLIFDFKETGLEQFNVRDVRKAVQKIDREICGIPQCSTEYDEPEEEAEQETDDHIPTFTPDDALFIFTRCFSLHATKNKTRNDDGKQWIVANDFSNGLPRTQCFLRCLLEKFHLYDMHSRKFGHEVVNAQFNEYGDFLQINKKQVDELTKALAGKTVDKSKCENVHKEFSKIYAAHKRTLGILFHFPEFAKAIVNKKIIHLKTELETYPEFCGRTTVLNNKQCVYRAYREYEKDVKQVDRATSNYMNCVFKGLRYLTFDNEIDTDELRRDFHRSDNLDQQAREDINNCAAQARLVCNHQKGYSLYSCLLKSQSSEKFKAAFDYKELFSGNYRFPTMMIVYDKNDVKRLIGEITAKYCKGK